MDMTSVSSPQDVPEITMGGSGPGRPGTMMGLCGPGGGAYKKLSAPRGARGRAGDRAGVPAEAPEVVGWTRKS